MLTENTWTEVSLCNGALGVIRNIVWAYGKDPSRNPPLAVLCEFDNYPGPVSVPGPKIVPIFHVTREFLKDSIASTRTHFSPRLKDGTEPLRFI
ncbi:hypothetical protein Brms1b_013532 [Colletotrichum noveboracense]|nr:hypothetical protein Brms1b_013532 [Colletotrichum noveboracense]